MDLETIIHKTLYTSLGLAAPLISRAATGDWYGALTAVAFGVGRYLSDKIKHKKKVSFIDIMQESIVGSVMGSLGSELYEKINEYIPGAGLLKQGLRAASLIAIGNPLYMGAYYLIDHIVKKGLKLGGLLKTYTTKYWNDLKSVTKWLGAPLALTVNGYMGGYPGIVAADSAYRYIVGDDEKKEIYAPQKQDDAYQPGTSQPAGEPAMQPG